MPNVIPFNEEMRDFLLVNQHYLHRYENGVIRDIAGHYAVAKEEISNQLQNLQRRFLQAEITGESIPHTLQWRMARLQEHLAEIENAMTLASREFDSTLTRAMQEYAAAHSEALEERFATQFNKVNIAINRLPTSQVFEIIDQPLLGEVYGERILWGNLEAVRTIRQQLTQSVIQGEDMNQAANRLFGRGQAMGGQIGTKLMQRSEMIARTEIQRVSNGVTRGIYDANTDVIKGIQFTATLDRRTCLQCASLDGKVYYYSRNAESAPSIPLHPRCRCTYVPLTKSWRELGIKANEAPPSTRASMSGQVPDTQNYTQWLQGMEGKSPGFALDILGPTRYGLWKSGKLKLTEMATDRKIISVKDLKKKFGEVAKSSVQYVRAENISDAQKLFKDNFNINLANPEGYGSKKPALNKVNQLGENISDLHNRFPVLGEWGGQLEIDKLQLVNAENLAKKLPTVSNGTTGAYQFGVKGHKDMYFASGVPTKDALRVGGGFTGRATVGDDLYTNFRHELGHHFHLSSKAGNGMPTKAVSEWNNLYKNKGGDYFKNNVSMYAGTNEKEAFAEAFSAYTSPLYNTGAGTRLPTSIESYFDRWLK